MKRTSSIQTIVNGLADRLSLPVVLEDADQQMVAYSPHYDLTDRIREETILRRSTTQRVVDLFRSHDIEDQDAPFLLPADADQGRLARLGIPIRYLGTTLGYAWVLLPSESLEEDLLGAATEAQAQLSLAMLAESRVRAREGESLLALLSPDPETRIQGLTDIESRGGFEQPRQLMVVVCTGPAWQDIGLRSGFWTAAWANEAQHQLRSVSSQEGVALISVPNTRTTDVQAMLERALHHVSQHRRDAELVLGVGSVVSRPDLCHESYRQARLTARVALRDTNTGPVAKWDRLGVYRFLTQLPQQTIHDAVDPRIAGLVVQHPSFAQTLECYLHHSGSINRVSNVLHIHRTTLYYRLDRIRESGIDPADGMDRSTAMASFAALRLLGEWPIRLS